jgi:hypothetical protein
MRWCWQRCAQNFRINSIVLDHDHQPQFEDDHLQGYNDLSSQKFTDVSVKPVTSICKVETLEMEETYALCSRMEVMVVSVSL